ncbi:MAG: PKD domain-containing protein [Bacteroidia bacterium]|nr:PKD domain-containing protein [Bacteroidia bacterium]
MRKFLPLLILVLFIAPVTAFATHIVGGSLTYEHLGGSTYRFILKLYRDCAPGNASFPGTANILVRLPNGTAFTTVSIPFPGASFVPLNIDTCVTNPGICLEEAIYSRVVNNIPPNPGGYHVYFQYCCRNSSLGNVVNPLATGETWYTYIPDNTQWLTNSSPQWSQFPPVFVCQNQPLNFDHSATDADGDSLVYSLYTPFDDNAPTFPLNVATFTPITWSNTNPGNPPTFMYGPTNALGGPPGALTINQGTGLLNGSPPYVGQFVVGIKCEEFRNGQKIGEILRDFQFNVVYCPPLAVASFTPQGNCSGGNTVCFNNTTAPPASSYFWNFGDLSVTTDTSYSANPPCYTYPGVGPYTVMLISNWGTACADTAYDTISIASTAAGFTNTAPVCAGDTVFFTDASTASPGNNINAWTWNFGDPPSGPNNTSTQQNPYHIYNNGGTYTVTLIIGSTAGCVDTITQVITIQGRPIANAGNDTIACTNSPTIALGGTVLNATGGLWIGNGTFTPSNTVLNPTYTPTPLEVSNGSATLLLITTGNGLCTADTDTIVITFTPGPGASAGSDIFVCQDTAYVPLSGTFTPPATGGSWTIITGNGTFVPNPNIVNPNYIPTPQDTANGSVVLLFCTTGNGNCLPTCDTVTIFFTPPPSVAITNNDSACAGAWIPLSATTTTGAGYWTSSGTGQFLPSNAILNPTYVPSAADNANGSVWLHFYTTNNGGCLPQHDSLLMTLIPAPTAQFASTNVCPWSPTGFTDGSTTTVGVITGWTWNFGDPPSGANNSSNNQNPTHIYGAGGTYTVTLVVTSSNGCSDTLVDTVNVYYQPVADFGLLNACQNDGVQFLDSSTTLTGTITGWTWNFGDSQTGTSQNPVHNYGSAGNYNVSLIVTNSAGCADTVTQSVTVNPAPLAAFGIDDYTAVVGQTVNFTDQSQTNIISWFWNFGDSTTSNVQNPSHAYSTGGTFIVMLIVTDINGCIDTVYHEVIVALPPLVPSGFSPNGDGFNDELLVKGGPFKELEFRIYNNWGELLFISNDQAKGWNGTRDGKEQPLGVYVWTVTGVTEDDVSHVLKGDVTLVR